MFFKVHIPADQNRAWNEAGNPLALTIPDVVKRMCIGLHVNRFQNVFDANGVLKTINMGPQYTSGIVNSNGFPA